MVFSLFAYFLSMVTSFAAIMIVLIGLADSQMRTTPLSRLPNYPVMPRAEAIATPPRPAIAEQEKPEQTREDVKKLARVKLARERKRIALARLRQQHRQREDTLAFGYANQPFGSPTFSPFGQRNQY